MTLTVNQKNAQLMLYFIAGILVCVTTQAASIRFSDIARQADSGLVYHSRPLPQNAVLDQFKLQAVVDFASPVGRGLAPGKPRGAPGVAIFDYDDDGDLDIYVTNGLGAANSLFVNRWRERGQLVFDDLAFEAGVAAVDQASTGVCLGDIDNDGDHDIFVAGTNGTTNRLYENRGSGRFTDISASGDIASVSRHPTSCALGDVNGDGLLDIAIGNSYDNWDHRLPLTTFDNDHLMESNQLLLNRGGNVFIDVSEQAGIHTPSRVTWAISLVDYDLDGDLDLISADDQGAKAPAAFGGVDHGYIRVYQNDGHGRFTDVTETGTDTNRVGAWMGLAFGDLNSDGHMDIFSTNVGYFFSTFLAPLLGFPFTTGDFASGWFLGSAENRFHYPGVGELLDNPFGWGTSIVDYDNDGDSDIIYHGGINMGGFVDASNPGVILRNDGDAVFTRDALAFSANHTRRNVQGMAVGDLNDDGFMDIVTVSSEDWPETFPLLPYLPPEALVGTPFDSQAFIWPTFFPRNPEDLLEGFSWSGMEPDDGRLAVEINSADNDNRWVKVTVKGSKNLLEGGKVNRDGIGAVVTFTPRGGKPVMWPVTAGSSYASQEALEWVFGTGRETRGVLEVMWPGGVRNKLYGVRASERILLPEIPCSYDEQTTPFLDYIHCVNTSLATLKKNGVLSRKQKKRFLFSAVRAYIDAYF